MPPKKEKRNKKVIIEEAKLTECVASLCLTLTFDDCAVELVVFGLHPSFAPDSCLSPHFHSYVELHAVFSGDGVVTVEHEGYAFAAGQFIVNLPGQIHYWHADKKPPSMLIMGIRMPELEEQVISDTQNLFKNLLGATDVVYVLPKSFEVLYTHLVEELRFRKLGYSNIVRNLLQMMIISLARSTVRGKAIKSHLDLPPSPFRKDIIVEGVNEFIKNNISEKTNLSALARTFHVSRRTLTRHYREATGITIGAKLHEFRMVLAEELIRETKLPIKAVSMMCGLKSKSYFSKEFRKSYNCSPIEYRNQITDTFEE